MRESSLQKIANASGRAVEAFEWAREIYTVIDVAKLRDHGYCASGSFQNLDFKLSAAVSEIISGELQYKINSKKQAMEAVAGKQVNLSGRVSMYMIEEQFRLHNADAHLNDWEFITTVKMNWSRFERISRQLERNNEQN